ncbi:MAG: bifunctional metallophosphatase/5'-nucleotidase [Bacilli bacterium]|nr:bifunctional metallophosphatase/5'-nucleotidase [Bacilli bacterium]
MIEAEEGSDQIDMATMATFLKEKGEQENTLLLDQGDTWQGSIYSNFNHGALLTDIFNYVHYDARTVGNHDFDWGVAALEANSARTYDGYRVPVLAANVYDYDFEHKAFGDIHQSSIGQKSVSYTLENGVKVGVVGVIGDNQITSINSQFTQDIGFKGHIAAIEEEAISLRADGCQVVIASVHAGQEEVMGYGLGSYVDLVLCAHTHDFEYGNEGNLRFLQFGSNDRGCGKVTLTFDYASQSITSSTYTEYRKSMVESEVSVLDPVITDLIATYGEECDSEAGVVVADNVSGTFRSGNEAANIMSKAMFDRAKDEGYSDIALSYCNTARANLGGGSWTYADLYSAFPFDNVVYIMEVSGYDILNECFNYNNVYLNPDVPSVFKSDATYKIAVLDYLAFHTNSYRYYNYFPSANGRYVGYLSDNYRVILRDWLADNGYNAGAALRSVDFSSNVSAFKRSNVLTAVEFYDGDTLLTTRGAAQNASLESVASSYTLYKNGYNFLGWTKDLSGYNPISSGESVGKYTIALFAQYEDNGTLQEVKGEVDGVEYDFSSNERITINVKETKSLDLVAGESVLTPERVDYDEEKLAYHFSNGHALFGGLAVGDTSITLYSGGEGYTFKLTVVNVDGYTTVSEAFAKADVTSIAALADESGSYFTDKMSIYVTSVSLSSYGYMSLYGIDAFGAVELYFYRVASFSWEYRSDKWYYTEETAYRDLGVSIVSNSMLHVDNGVCYSYNNTREVCYASFVSIAPLV